MSNVVVTKGRGWNRCRYLQRIKRPEIYPDRASCIIDISHTMYLRIFDENDFLNRLEMR